MELRIFDIIPDEARKIREEVFIKEQGFEEEFDETDGTARHIVLFDENKAIGTCRVFFSEEKSSYLLGRLAVIKEKRGLGLGALLIEKAEELVKQEGGNLLQLHAQTRAAAFYEKQGYEQYGEIEYEEYCPHIWMKKELSTD